MENRLVYLQLGFWKIIRGWDSVDGKRLFWDIYGALQCSNIRADIPIDEWKNDKDDLLFYLLQNSYEGYGTKIEQNVPEKFRDALNIEIEQSIDNLCAVYLLDKTTEECEMYESSLGVLCLNSEMIKDSRYVRGSAIMYKKEEISDKFKKCDSQFSSSCNSMIVIDPYILCSKWSIDLNLIPLLDRFLPPGSNNQNIVFHLSILSQTNECYVGKYKKALHQKEIFDYVDKEIRKIRPMMKLSFSLFHINTTGNGDGDFHSRHILTNCMLINSEDGFDIFKSKKNEYTGNWEIVSGKNARFEFLYPALIDNRRKDFDNYYRWIVLAEKNCRDIMNNKNVELCWGTKENRLFDLVE